MSLKNQSLRPRMGFGAFETDLWLENKHSYLWKHFLNQTQAGPTSVLDARLSETLFTPAHLNHT